MNPAVRNHQAAGAALLEWINSLSVSEKVASIRSLNDGYTIWNILRDIDPIYFVGDLPEEPSTSGKWVSRWQNLKQISKKLTTYITDKHGQTILMGTSSGNLKLIATDGDVGETVKLLKLVLVAAINSDKRIDYISPMQTLSDTSAATLKGLILDLNDSGSSLSNPATPRASTTTSPTKVQLDRELLFEEILGKAEADKDNLAREKQELQHDVLELHDRLSRFQENSDALQERLAKAEDRLKQSNSAQSAHQIPLVKQLKAKIQEQNEIIADQETKFSESQVNLELMQKNIDKLTKSDEKLQALQDQLDEVKSERDNLARKANTIDKYEKKLQATQSLEKENKLKQMELDELRQQLEDAQQSDEKTLRLQKAVEEYRNILPQIEIDRHELQMKVKQAEFDKDTIDERYQAVLEQHTKDQEIIAELQDRALGLESPPTAASSNSVGLITELELSENHEQQRNFDLKSRIELLSKSLQKAKAEITSLRKSNHDPERPISLEGKVSLVDNDKLEPLGSITNTPSGMTKERLNEDSELKSRINNLEADFDDQKSILRNALVRPKSPDIDAAAKDLKEIFYLIEAATSERVSPDDIGTHKSVDKKMDVLADKILKGRETTVSQAQKLENQNVEITLLRAQIQAAEARAPLSQDHRVQDKNIPVHQEIENLKRENNLIASTYHDITSRLQMNSITLARREAPKGFLGKNRLLIEKVTAVRPR